MIMATQTLSFPDYELVIDGTTLVRIIEHKDMANIVIPEGIVSFAEDVTCNLNAATVSLPDSLVDIGRDIFYYCQNLQEVTIPPYVEHIRGAFINCPSLKKVVVGKSLQDYPTNARPDLLDEVIVDPDNKFLTSIDGVVFNKELTELIYFPCHKHGSYKVPASVTVLGSSAFRRTSLSEILLPNCISSIGDLSFSSTRLLKKVDCYTPGLPYQPSNYDVVLPAGLKVLTLGLFADSRNLHTFFLPKSIEELRNKVFWMSELTDIVLENGSQLREIGGSVFGHSHLKRFTIPPLLHSFSFSGLPSSASIAIDPENQTFSSNDGVFFKDNGETLVYCPRTKTGSYTVPDGVTCINDYAFIDCALNNITLPNNPLHSSRWNWRFLKNLPLATTVSFDADNHNLSFVDGVLFEDNGKALVSCSYAKTGSYTVPDGVVRIENGAFDGCHLNGITLPGSLRHIGSYAFTDCTSLHELRLPDSLRSFGYFSFDKKLKIIGPVESHNKLFLNRLAELKNYHFTVECPALEKKEKLASLAKVFFTANINAALSKEGIKFAIVEDSLSDADVDFDGLKPYYIHAHYSSSEKDVQRLLAKIRSHTNRFVVILIRLG